MSESHLDLDVLSDLLVGEGTDAEVEHVSRCAGCAARLAELDEAQAPVAAALAALPAPSLPAGLADRLSAALAAAGPLPVVEPDERRGVTPVSPDEPRGVTPLPPDEPEERAPRPSPREAARTVTPLRRPRRTWLPAAAVTVLALSAGGLALSALPNGGSDSESASSAAGGSSDRAASAPESASADVVRNETGADYAAPGAFDRLLPDVLEGRAGPVPAAAPPADASAGSIAPDVSTEERAMALTGPLERLREPAALDTCLSALVPPDGSAEPLAVDYAAYAEQPALVVVLSSGEPSKLDVYVVGADCAPGNDSTLFFTRVDRPA